MKKNTIIGIMLLSNLLSVLYLIYEIKEGNKIWIYESKKYDLQLYVKNSNYEIKDSFYFSYPSTLFSKEDRKQFINIGDINCSEVKDIWVDEDKGYMYGKLKYYEEYVQLKDYNIYRSNKDKKKCSGYFILNMNKVEFLSGLTKKEYEMELKSRNLNYNAINFKKYIKNHGVQKTKVFIKRMLR